MNIYPYKTRIKPKHAYCVYLTTYIGKKLPPFYIGSTSVAKVKDGYHGSVSSKKYKENYVKELKESPELFKTTILITTATRKFALKLENYIQKKNDVVKNPFFINQSFANFNGFHGMSAFGIDNPFYGKKHKPGTFDTETFKAANTERALRNKTPDARKKNSDGVNKFVATMNNEEREIMYSNYYPGKKVDCTAGKTKEELLCMANKKKKTWASNPNQQTITNRRQGGTQISIDGIIYNSVATAIEVLGKKRNYFYKRLSDSRYPNFKWLDQEKEEKCN